MRKCEKCGSNKWLVTYDGAEVTYETSMTTVVEEPEDVGDYDWQHTDIEINAEDVPTTIDAGFAAVVVCCYRCGWEVEPDTEEALEEWLANEDGEEDE